MVPGIATGLHAGPGPDALTGGVPHSEFWKPADDELEELRAAPPAAAKVERNLRRDRLMVLPCRDLISGTLDCGSLVWFLNGESLIRLHVMQYLSDT